MEQSYSSACLSSKEDWRTSAAWLFPHLSGSNRLKRIEKQPKDRLIFEKSSLKREVMIKDLPLSTSFEAVKELLDQQGFAGEYDFLYVPMRRLAPGRLLFPAEDS